MSHDPAREPHATVDESSRLDTTHQFLPADTEPTATRDLAPDWPTIPGYEIAAELESVGADR